MAVQRINAKVAGIAFEEEVVFSTDPAGSKTVVRAYDISSDLVQEQLEAQYQKVQGMRGPDAFIQGAKSGTLSFKLPIRSLTGNESPAMQLLKRMGTTLSTYATKLGVITGGSTTTIELDDSDATDINVGMGVWLPATQQLCWVARKQTNQGGGSTTILTTSRTLGAAPSAGQDLRVCDTITPADNVPSKTFSIYVYHGDGTAAQGYTRHKLTGCSGTWSIPAVEAGQYPVIEIEMMVDDWEIDQAALSQNDDSANPAFPVIASVMTVADTATEVASFGFNPGLDMQPIPATQGGQGRSNWFYTDSEAVIESAPLYDSDWWARLTAGTELNINFTSVKDGTASAWGLWVPAAQTLGNPVEESNGLLRVSPELRAVDPGESDDGDKLPLWALSIPQ